MRKALLLLLLPLIEFVTLRFYLHSVLQIRIGYIGMTDYDWMFPGMISFIVLIYSLEQVQTLPLRFHPTAALFNATSFLGFAALNAFYPSLFSPHGFTPLLWFMGALLPLGSAFFVFISPSLFIKHPRRHLFFPATLAAGSKLITVHGLSFLWVPSAVLTGKLCFLFLSLFISDLSFDIGKRLTTYAYLRHPGFHLAIGSGCGGMEGISIFFFLLILIYVRAPHRFDFKNWLFLLSVGLGWMFVLNVLRISTLFALSLWILKKYGHSLGFHTLHVLFHNIFGWLLYAGGLCIFYRVFLSDSENSQKKLQTHNRKSVFPLEA